MRMREVKYHGIVYVANEGRHIRITTNFIILPGQK